MTSATINDLGGDQYMLQLMPLALASLGLICSIIGIVMVKIFSDKKPDIALRFGTIGSALIFIILSYFLIKNMGVSSGVWSAVLIGSVGGIIVGLVTEYYTGGSPVKKIAKGGETGSATIMITGLATGMQSVAIPVFTIVCIIFYIKLFCRTLWCWNCCYRDVKYSWHNYGYRCLRSSR